MDVAHFPAAATAPRPAVDQGLTFLLEAQDERGAWKDFLLPAGHSDIWVTAFVAGILARWSESETRRAADDAWRYLAGVAKPDGGWSYSAPVPGDADSTLWGLRLAAALGEAESEVARKGMAFLETHLRADGGLATYASADPIRGYIGLPPIVPFDGWLRSHICVTAAGSNLAGLRPRLRAYLLAHQMNDGRWPAYWWIGDELATAEAVQALAATGDSDAVSRAVVWAGHRAEALISSTETRPPAFALAHTLRILAHGRGQPQIADQLERGLEQLARWQRPDGAWPASAQLRVPRPNSIEPKSGANWPLWAGMPAGPPSLQNILENTFDNYSPDHFAIYTTATVLGAIRDISRLEGEAIYD